MNVNLKKCQRNQNQLETLLTGKHTHDFTITAATSCLIIMFC